MKNLFLVLIAVGMIVISAGCFANHKAKDTCECQPKNYSKDEFYDALLSLKKTDCLVFTDFPKHLLPVVFSSRGDTILWSEKGDLVLRERYPNSADTVNRYISYFIGDEKGNSWTVVRDTDDDNFHIYRMEIAKKE